MLGLGCSISMNVRIAVIIIMNARGVVNISINARIVMQYINEC